MPRFTAAKPSDIERPRAKQLEILSANINVSTGTVTKRLGIKCRPINRDRVDGIDLNLSPGTIA